MVIGKGALRQDTRNHTHVNKAFTIWPGLKDPGLSLHPFRFIYCKNHGHMKRVQPDCGDRTCPVCLQKKFNGRYYSYVKTVGNNIPKSPPDGYGHKFMTLTTRNIYSDRVAVLRQGVRDIIKAFERMRRWKRYKKLMMGGFRGVELKYSPGRGWNIHVHVMYFGGFTFICCLGMKIANSRREIEMYEKDICPTCKEYHCLRRDWQKVSGGSPVVHIKRMWHLRAGLKYILKYVTKEPDISGMSRLYNEVVAGTRLMQGFGCYFGAKIIKRVTVCSVCGCTEWYIDMYVETAADRAVPFSRAPPFEFPNNTEGVALPGKMAACMGRVRSAVLSIPSLFEYLAGVVWL